MYDAVQAALSVPGVERLRLGSLESVEVETRLLELMAKDPRLCHHLHLPLQSGCDKILKSMHRPYDTARFSELLKEIRSYVPDIAVTTDIIVGFPGETEEDFEETLAFAKSCGFDKMHIFPYSKRKGTPAEKMPDQVEEQVKQERAARLSELDKEMQHESMSYWIGKDVTVQFEQPVDDSHVEGLCGAYMRVVVKGSQELCDQIRTVHIVGVEDDYLVGEL